MNDRAALQGSRWLLPHSDQNPLDKRRFAGEPWHEQDMHNARLRPLPNARAA